ncbi:pseudouridine-5'-phosphate glycosidase [Tamaricihabitans halophyticus]|uniref:Pseudouridine-5'-phosphate glycosidase n=1 Tax=Tamaricihabitans halophyticus TaxID=1262583 RepID=A0A4R2QJB4_9PSEU|nr:pseudouridine-5'-phosphate glycosidase [Tamaricihabitans halophyticus]TCP49357.1 pseudouridine-5'-phosphate glycosidase [Tamaricihabitans halophyticus]
MSTAPIRLGTEVADALRDRTPVVALESTIFSTLGLPSPHNEEALRRCTATIRAAGAVPALTAVLDGQWRVGIEAAETERILSGTAKIAERDLAVAAAREWPVGVTTVSATVALCRLAGVQVFSTGGIGGVHRGVELSADISADLDALANNPVVTVSAGAKAFLDLPRTLEYLETAGVPVLGWRHDDFPAFYTRSSGLRVPHRVSTADEVARVLRMRARPNTGVLLTVPIPADNELDPAELQEKIDAALRSCAEEGIRGAAITPYVLGKLEAETDGASVPANLALAEHNASVATEVATSLVKLAGEDGDS